jgi:uncharacterized protein YjbI with pentapeptide repeats
MGKLERGKSVVAKKQALIERWNRNEWKERYAQVVACWQAGERLSDVPSLPQHEGRWDLRGINLEIGGTRFAGQIGLSDGSSVEYTYGPRPKFVGAQFLDADLSFANLGGALFENCCFHNVTLYSANGADVNDWGSSFCEVDLSKANWRGATLGLEGARYKRVSFCWADLRDTRCYRGYFIDCDFSNARLEHIDFQVSHFVRCKFKGKLKQVWFRGYYAIPAHEDAYGKTEPNLMEDVDLSEAELWDVMFTDNCDLSRVIPPQDGKHIVFHDWMGTLKRVKQEVEKRWEGVFRSEALRHLDIYSVHTNAMNILNFAFEEELLRKGFLDSSLGEKFAHAFWDLLTSLN